MKSTYLTLSAAYITLFCQTAAAGEATGPLRVNHDNPRYFSDASGQSILLAGLHTWPNLVDMGPSDPPNSFDFDAYLACLKRHGHNFTRGWAWEATRWSPSADELQQTTYNTVSPIPWERTGPELARDGKPKFNLERIAPEYLERLKSHVSRAGKEGIYVSVMIFEGYCMQFRQDTWQFHPFNPANNVNGINGDVNGDGIGLEVHQLVQQRVTRLQEGYVRAVINTLNHFDNVLYEISNETHPDSTEWQYYMIRFIKDCERNLPKQHPIGMTYQHAGGSNETLLNSPADWISPNQDDGFRDNPPDVAGKKVVLNDTDHLWGIGGNAVWVWKSFIRGLNPIFMDPYDGRLIARDDPSFEPLRNAMGQVLAYSRRINLTRATPQNALATTSFCLAEPGCTYIILAPEGGAFEADLSAKQTTYASEWINPESGAVVNGENVTGGEKSSFAPPFEGAAVLFLKAATANDR